MTRTEMISELVAIAQARFGSNFDGEARFRAELKNWHEDTLASFLELERSRPILTSQRGNLALGCDFCKRTMCRHGKPGVPKNLYQDIREYEQAPHCIAGSVFGSAAQADEWANELGLDYGLTFPDEAAAKVFAAKCGWSVGQGAICPECVRQRGMT